LPFDLQLQLSAYPDITADNTFTHRVTAGEAEGVFDKPMTVSGNYRMTVSYTVPGEGFEREEVEFVFEYDAEATTTSSSRISTGGAIGALTTYENSADGFRIGVPGGWVVDDVDNASPSAQAAERTGGIGILATLCPQGDALPAIGGNYTCTSAEQSTAVRVMRFDELQARPEFTDIVQQNRNITTSDLFAFVIQFVGDTLGAQDFRVVNDTDITVNVVDSRTNQTVGRAAAKYVDFTYNYQDEFGRNIDGYESQLLVLNNDFNTAYVVVPSLPLTTGVPQLSSEIMQVLDSFALVTPTTSTATSSPPTTASAALEERQQAQSSPLTQQLQLPVQQQQLQEQQQNQGRASGVSIVSGASTLTTDAYSPNPIQVSSVGTTVTWTNNDSQPHTVTSGSNGQPDNKFNSSPNFTPLLNPGQTFSFTFTESGEYPYYCMLHPNMVGTVSVG
jgi:plastocyanin